MSGRSPDAPSSPERLTASEALQRDLDLLRRWRAGDEAAGVALIGCYKRFVHATCRRLGLRREDEILEVWHDLVVRLVEKRDELAERITTSFAGYLGWQARDLVERRRARAQRSRELPLGEIASPAPAGNPDTGSAIRDCMDRLPPREREVFELRYLQELSLKEVASALATNTNAVAQSVFRLVRRMRACLAAKGLDPGWSA